MERWGKLKDQVMIDERPVSRIGVLNLNTFFDRPGGSVLVNIVERLSRYSLNGQEVSKEAPEAGFAVLRAMELNRDKVLTTTYYNVKEFAHPRILGELLRAGMNENTNGLIRQYMPNRRADSGGYPRSPEHAQLTSGKMHELQHTPNDTFNTPPAPLALAP